MVFDVYSRQADEKIVKKIIGPNGVFVLVERLGAIRLAGHERIG